VKIKLMVVGLVAAAMSVGAQIANPTPPPNSDFKTLIHMFDRAHIDIDIPAKDDNTKNTMSIDVNGTEVTGTEGGRVIFKFNKSGTLTRIVIWNGKMSNTKDD
jgi:hypothetical protein